jgi:hypothetical protein
MALSTRIGNVLYYVLTTPVCCLKVLVMYGVKYLDSDVLPEVLGQQSVALSTGNT